MTFWPSEQFRPIRVRGYTPDIVGFVCARAGLEVDRLEIGLDDFISDQEIGVICRRPR